MKKLVDVINESKKYPNYFTNYNDLRDGVVYYLSDNDYDFDSDEVYSSLPLDLKPKKVGQKSGGNVKVQKGSKTFNLKINVEKLENKFELVLQFD